MNYVTLYNDLKHEVLYQKLFDSIKKTRSQTQKEIDELIAHVSEKTYAYGAIRAENQNLLFTTSKIKIRLKNVKKGKSVNTKFDTANDSQTPLCVTPINKHAFQKKTDVLKTEENHVVSKPVTLQTSLDKQRGVNSNKNVIAPGMYKVVTKQESQTNKAKSGLSSIGMNTASSVRRSMNRDLHNKYSVLANYKNLAKKVAVYVRKNKQTDNTSENVISNKENVIDVNAANISKVKILLCVSWMQNMLFPCHDKCLANHRLNMHSNVSRTLSTNSRTPKSSNTTYVVLKTRFSKKLAQSKTLDTTSVSKPKINVVVQIVLWIVDSGCSKHMTGDQSLLRNFIKKFIGTVRLGNVNFSAITSYGDYIYGNITICHVYYVEGLGHNLFSVGQFCDGGLEVAFCSKTCYIRNLEGDDLLTGGRKSNLYTISISDMAASSPVCLMSKATSTKSWLWYRILSHLNFGTINGLTRLDLVDGLPKFKYGKDHLCSACEKGKSKKASHPPKLVPSDNSKLELLHMDLCGPMRVASVNEKKRTLSTNSRTPKSSENTYVVLKTRFSEKLAQFKTLDTTSAVSKPKIDVGSASKAKNKSRSSLWIVDSGCSKHMTGDRSLLRNFIKKFIGTIRFGNDNFAAITGYGNYIQGNITVCHVYYVEGLGHNLFSVGQFCDGDLEVAFRSKTCYVRNLKGDDFLTGGREYNLYTISISDMAASSPVCLMSKSTLTKSWLWHRKLSHLNFGTINDLTKIGLVDGLSKFKYEKDHLCSACKRGKSKKASHLPKLVPSDHSKLELLHMDLCGPMRLASINGKKLKKALYGLKQAPHAWHDKLSSFLIEHGFTKGIVDPTLFTRRHGGDILLVQVYVDDIIFGSTNPDFSKRFANLMKNNFEMSMMGEDSRFKLIAYSDADHAGCKDDCKITSGGLQFLGGKLVIWSSKKQYCTAMSTAEAEYVSISACCVQVIWMRTQLLGYGYKYNRIPMYHDSKSAIAISCNL
nr:integrase, catalytic region, zinc finger, CCHC-type, peptidase aspartic, catalytic [Tanacetum cinerariifolium]